MTSPDSKQLQHDGYALLRGAIPAAWLPALRTTFDEGVLPSAHWPVPRGADWRHVLLDVDPTVQSVCRLPCLLAAVGTLIGERFFIAQAEGREPLPGGGYQALHRDLSAQRPGDSVVAIAYVDDYDADNGATRIVPGSHRSTCSVSTEQIPHSAAQHVSGAAGDVLVFDADLIHAGSENRSGARRRSILVTYFAAPLYAGHLETLALRSVRMDTSQLFDPTASTDSRTS